LFGLIFVDKYRKESINNEKLKNAMKNYTL